MIMENLVNKNLIGIPYKLGGKTMVATDCIGVVVMWLQSEGVDVKYDDGKGSIRADWWKKSPQRFTDSILSIGSVVRFQDLKKYDCLLLANPETLYPPSCLAVMVDDRHILTSTKERGSFVELLSMEVKEKFWGAVRLNAVVEK